MVEFSDLDEVWFVVTPRSPFKTKQTLLEDHHRYQMVLEATRDFPKLKPSKIEFDLPQPNYTIHTLVHLEEKSGKTNDYCLIIGEDNLNSFHKWKNYEVILERYSLYVYPRISEVPTPPKFLKHSNIHYIDAPIMEISSTFIRKQHKAGKNIRPMLPYAVWKYLDEMNFYRK